MIFDTHAHYDDEAFEEDRDTLLCSMKENGIGTIINIGASLATTKNTLELVKKYDFMYGAVGVHPCDVSELNEETFAWLKEQTKQDKILMVGEIGLDYYWDKEHKDMQIYWFRKQLQLAAECGLPVSVHSRDAAQDTYEVLKEEAEAAKARGQEIFGVIHCFSYGKEMAEKFLALGFHLGIGGVVTFGNAKKLKEVVEMMPMERLLLETDCPYLAPNPFRGKRNSSLYLPYVAEAVAELRGMTADEVICRTEENAKKLFGLN